jgi:hypothetical protein
MAFWYCPSAWYAWALVKPASIISAVSMAFSIAVLAAIEGFLVFVLLQQGLRFAGVRDIDKAGVGEIP